MSAVKGYSFIFLKVKQCWKTFFFAMLFQQGWLGYKRTTKAWSTACQKWRQNANKPRRGTITLRRYTQNVSSLLRGSCRVPNIKSGCCLLPIGKEQPGNWPELQTKDFATASGAGTDRAQGDARTAHRQIWVDWRSQISCHEWYGATSLQFFWFSYLFSFSIYASSLFLFSKVFSRQVLFGI